MTNRSLHAPQPTEASGAAALATRLLDCLDGRLAHSATVAAQIERVAGLLDSEWRSSVRDAAWLHDVGYHPDLALTGFHPLDGARWLREHRWLDETCRLVAWHTQAFEELGCADSPPSSPRSSTLRHRSLPPRLPGPTSHRLRTASGGTRSDASPKSSTAIRPARSSTKPPARRCRGCGQPLRRSRISCPTGDETIR
jgi:hypothetical protein